MLPKDIVKQIDEHLIKISNIPPVEQAEYTPEQVQAIIEQEKEQTQKKLNKRIKAFNRRNAAEPFPDSLEFLLFWGYPGCGKSTLMEKICRKKQLKGETALYNILDKDKHRPLFSNLASYLDGHASECEKFSYPAIEFVQKAVRHTFKTAKRSLISVGALGAAIDFQDNAQHAILQGYKVHATYMCIHPSIAYLSNLYRNCAIYEQIENGSQRVYPRLVPASYFASFKNQLMPALQKMEEVYQLNPDHIRLTVTDRHGTTLFDTNYGDFDIQKTVEQEEKHPFTFTELLMFAQQINFITTNLENRSRSGKIKPTSEELKSVTRSFMALSALMNEQTVLRLKMSSKKRIHRLPKSIHAVKCTTPTRHDLRSERSH